MHSEIHIYRIPIEKIVCLYIDGNVRIESIDYEGSPRSSSMSSSSSSNSNGAKKIRPHFASNVRTPYELTLISGGGFVPPRLLSLVAVAPIRGRRFEVNFKINHEYLFHFRKFRLFAFFYSLKLVRLGVDLLSLSTPRVSTKTLHRKSSQIVTFCRAQSLEIRLNTKVGSKRSARFHFGRLRLSNRLRLT